MAGFKCVFEKMNNIKHIGDIEDPIKIIEKALEANKTNPAKIITWRQTYDNLCSRWDLIMAVESKDAKEPVKIWTGDRCVYVTKPGVTNFLIPLPTWIAPHEKLRLTNCGFVTMGMVMDEDDLKMITDITFGLH